MALVADDSDVLYIDVHGETTLKSESVQRRNMLEDFARLNCDPEAALWNTGLADGSARSSEAAVVSSEPKDTGA